MAGKRLCLIQRILLVCATALFLSGCFNETDIDLVGRWHIIKPATPLISGEFQFSETGKFMLQEQRKTQVGPRSRTMGGTYHLKEDQLTLVITHSDGRGQPKRMRLRVAMTEGGKTMSLVFPTGAVAYRRQPL